MDLKPCFFRLISTLLPLLMSGCAPRADLAPVVVHNQRFSSFTQEMEHPYRNGLPGRETTAAVEQNQVDGAKNKVDNSNRPEVKSQKSNHSGTAPMPSGTKLQAVKSPGASLHAVDPSNNREMPVASRPPAPPSQPPNGKHGNGSSRPLTEALSGTRDGKTKPEAEKPAGRKRTSSTNFTGGSKKTGRQPHSEKKAGSSGKHVKLKKNSAISIDSKNMLMLSFQWPIKGKIKKNFSQTDSKGIDILGTGGQKVRASEAGKVVYSGQGLIGFGNLLIIKHNNDYLSAYANNSSLMVKEGQKVRRGQDIARLGPAVSKKPVLHFEIRKNGKSVNPLSLLPEK